MYTDRAIGIHGTTLGAVVVWPIGRPTRGTERHHACYGQARAARVKAYGPTVGNAATKSQARDDCEYEPHHGSTGSSLSQAASAATSVATPAGSSRSTWVSTMKLTGAPCCIADVTRDVCGQAFSQ